MNEKIEAGTIALENTIVDVLQRITGRVHAPGKLSLFPPEVLAECQESVRRSISAIVEGIIEECEANARRESNSTWNS